jgi:TetR/AcrR family transcriptional repressor of nem operon
LFYSKKQFLFWNEWFKSFTFVPVMPRQKNFDYDTKLIEARDLFWEKGYNATSLNDLVDTLKINRSSLYLTYGDKHELFLKCLNSYLQLKEKEYKDATNSSEDPIEAIRNVINAVLDVILHDTKTCMFVNSTFELARIDKDVKRMLSKQTLMAVKLVEDLLKKAQENGQLSANTNPKTMAFYMITNVVSIWQTQILFSNETLTRQMADILLNTIVK